MKRPTPGPRSAAVRLFLVAWLLFAVHFSTNVVREHYPAFSLSQQGTFRVDDYQGLHSDVFVHTDGHSYINNNVAASAIASVPLFLFAPLLDAVEAYDRGRLGETGAEYRTAMPNRQRFYEELRERGLTLRFGAAAAVTSVFLVAPLSAFCVAGMFLVLSARGVSRTSALWLAFVFGFGTPLFFRSAHLNNNVFVMYAAFASFLLLWRVSGEAGSVGTRRRLGAGFFAGMALACDYSGIIPLTCLYCYLVLGRAGEVGLSRSVRESVPFVVGCLPPVGFLLFSQWAMFGDPLRPAQFWMPDANYTDRGVRGFSLPSVEAFLLNLLHPSYGLVFFGPLLVLGLVPAWYRTGPLVLPRRERVFVFALTGLFLLFCAANQYALMQWNTGFRYLLPLVPFLFLAACDHLTRMPKFAMALVTGLAVLHTWILCMARDCNPVVDTWRHASGFGAWLGQVSGETVPASYLRVWSEGLQLPWLRVLRLTAPPDHWLLSQPWLPAAVLAVCGLAALAVWRAGRGFAFSPFSRPVSA